ncbi:Pectinesterase [Forsythia ovata]|uniref:Pectinesterase n=1 Tax=Forsythia ovata TaxID=205694 RepID=A0ABD1PHE1_9LAMI
MNQYDFVHIAAGDLLRAEVAAGTENGRRAKECMEKGQLVPDEIVVMVTLVSYFYSPSSRQSIDLYSSVPSPSLNFVETSSLPRSSYLSSSLTSRQTPEILPSLGKPLLSEVEDVKVSQQRRSSHSLLPPIPSKKSGTKKGSLKEKYSKVSHEIPITHQSSYGQAVLNAVFILFGLANGEMQERISRKLIDFPTIFVDPSNLGNFPTIQSAINSVPSNNNQWICISVKAGVYNEKVTIPPEKPFLYLKGEGMGKTNVVWSSNDSIVASATFSSLADNIVVSDMTFVNSYNYPFKKDGNKISAAVAAMISGDKSAFYQCSFLGLQDTLFDEKGRHYFKLCTINGAIDFIFGGGQSIYEECTLSFNGETLNPGTEGFITAQGRDDPKDTGGFVFNKCNVTGMGKTFLGRAWKSYSRVIFYNSFLSDIVIPQGWDAWNALGHE